MACSKLNTHLFLALVWSLLNTWVSFTTFHGFIKKTPCAKLTTCVLHSAPESKYFYVCPIYGIGRYPLTMALNFSKFITCQKISAWKTCQNSLLKVSAQNPFLSTQKVALASFICFFQFLENWKSSNLFSKIWKIILPKIGKLEKHFSKNFGNLPIFQNLEKANEWSPSPEIVWSFDKLFPNSR